MKLGTITSKRLGPNWCASVDIGDETWMAFAKTAREAEARLQKRLDEEFQNVELRTATRLSALRNRKGENHDA